MNLSLESGDISLDELQLLREQIEGILWSTINQSPNVDVKLRKLEALNTPSLQPELWSHIGWTECSACVSEIFS